MNTAKQRHLAPAEKGFFLQIPVSLFAALENLKPLARKAFLAAADLSGNRPHWRLSARSLSQHIGRLYRCDAPHPESVRRAIRELKAAGLLQVLDTGAGENRYRVRLAGFHFEQGKAEAAAEDRGGDVAPPTTDPVAPPTTDPVVPPYNRSGCTVARSQSYTKTTPPKPPKDSPPPPNANANPDRGGGEDQITRIAKAWQPLSENPVTARTVRRALAKASEANPQLNGATIAARLLQHAECIEIPRGINEPLLWLASKDLSEKPRRARRHELFAPLPPPPANMLSAAEMEEQIRRALP